MFNRVFHAFGLLKSSFMKQLRTYFVAGMIVLAPLGATIYVSWYFISFIDLNIKSILINKYNIDNIIFNIPGFGIISLLLFIVFVGMVTAGLFGRLLIWATESILAKMPVVRSIYGIVKQLTETIASRDSKAFRQVVLIEYPRRGMWAIGFVTGEAEGQVKSELPEETVNIFLPTTPNPTSGFLLFVPRNDLIFLDMTVEKGIKMVISSGLVTSAKDGQILKTTKAASKEEKAPLRGESVS